MKRLFINIRNGTFPALGGTAALAEASPEEMRILLCLLERGGSVEDSSVAALAAAAGCGVARARAALRYWREVEVLTEDPAAAKVLTALGKRQGAPRAESDEKTVSTLPKNSENAGGVCCELGKILKKEPSCGSGANTQDGAADKNALPERKSSAAGQDRPLRNDELTPHDGEEVAFTLRDRALASFIDSCQQTAGRIFNTRELSSLTAILDGFPFTEEYLLTLISYCRRKAKRFSFVYLEKTAHSMLERDCLTVEALNAYITAEEKFSSREWKLRRLLGIGERRLGSREAAYLSRWAGEFDYDEDIIGIAYDITVNQTAKLSLPYMDKLLTRFYEAGCRTVDAVNDFLEKERAEHAQKTASRHTGAAKQSKKPKTRGDFKTSAGADDPTATQGASFRERDYLSAALRRSYGDSGLDDLPEEKK